MRLDMTLVIMLNVNTSPTMKEHMKSSILPLIHDIWKHLFPGSPQKGAAMKLPEPSSSDAVTSVTR
jgi:hypothetical protein